MQRTGSDASPRERDPQVEPVSQGTANVLGRAALSRGVRHRVVHLDSRHATGLAGRRWQARSTRA